MRDLWIAQRLKRHLRSAEVNDPEYQTHHRICPICDGEGTVSVEGTVSEGDYVFDLIVCPHCQGVGRVNQEGWDRGKEILADALLELMEEEGE